MSSTSGLTVQALINLALKLCGVGGVGVDPSAEDTNDAFTLLNMMLAEWQVKRWLIWSLVDTAIPATGAESYTVGTGGDFNIVRPDRLEAAFFRMNVESPEGQVDYPVAMIWAREDYNRIMLKNLSTFPQACFYDAAYPMGNVYFWPVPNASLYELHITTKTAIGNFAALTDTVMLPQNYQNAVLYNLAERLLTLFRLPPDPMITGIAKGSLAAIRSSNAQIPTARLDPNLLPAKGGSWMDYMAGWIDT